MARIRKWRMAQCIQHAPTDNGELREVDRLYPLIRREASGEIRLEIIHCPDKAKFVSNMLIISRLKVGAL